MVILWLILKHRLIKGSQLGYVKGLAGDRDVDDVGIKSKVKASEWGTAQAPQSKRL